MRISDWSADVCSSDLDAAVDERGDVAGDVVGQRLLRLRVRLGDGFFLRRLHVRQRPVAQRFEAAARDLEDVLAVEPVLAQRFEVILEAGQRVGEGVELAAVGHALAARSEEHTSELQSLNRTSYAVFGLNTKK